MQLMIVVEYLQHSSLNFHTKEKDTLVGYKGCQITNVLKDNGLWCERITMERYPKLNEVVGCSIPSCEIFSLSVDETTS